MGSYDYVISVGYCKLQNLLKFHNPIAYTSRIEGWAADVYDFGNTAIVTGNAPFGNRHPSFDLCEKYDNIARINQSNNLDTLIDYFICEVI